MDSKGETLGKSLKLIKAFTSWQPNAPMRSSAKILHQERHILETSYKSTPAQSSPKGQKRRLAKLQSIGSIRFLNQKKEMAPSALLTDLRQENFQQRSRVSSQVLLKSDSHREAMKSRLEGKVQEAERKLEEMKLGFKRLVEEKQQIVKKMDTLKPPVLIYH